MHELRMWQLVSGLLALTICGQIYLMALALRRGREMRAELREQLAGATQLANGLNERARWAEWWVRCAAETTLADPSRPTVLRWALAAHLAPSLDALHCDLQAIAGDPQRPELERVHAQAFVNELGLRKRETTPWVEWQKQPIVAHEPLHNPHAIANAYADALRSWEALLRPHAQDVVRAAPALSRSTTH